MARWMSCWSVASGRPPNHLEGEQHRQRAAAWLTGVGHDGWESRPAVVARFEDAYQRHATAAAHRDAMLVVGGHGMASVAWLASRALVSDAVAFHAALRWPDAYAINPNAGTIRCLVG